MLHKKRTNQVSNLSKVSLNINIINKNYSKQIYRKIKSILSLSKPVFTGIKLHIFLKYSTQKWA